MEEVNELKTLVVNLFDCVKTLNATTSKLFANQQIFMRKQDNILKKIESIYPRVQEQEHQLNLISERFHQHIINAPTLEQFENIVNRPTHSTQSQNSQSQNVGEADGRTIKFDSFENYGSPPRHENSDTQRVPLTAQQHPLGLDPGELGPLDLVSDDTPIISDEESPSLDDDKSTADDSSVMKTLMNFKLKTEDDRCRRTIIFSNLSYFKHESWHNGRLTNFWPRFRNTLRAVELGFIL